MFLCWHAHILCLLFHIHKNEVFTLGKYTSFANIYGTHLHVFSCLCLSRMHVPWTINLRCIPAQWPNYIKRRAGRVPLLPFCLLLSSFPFSIHSSLVCRLLVKAFPEVGTCLIFFIRELQLGLPFPERLVWLLCYCVPWMQHSKAAPLSPPLPHHLLQLYFKNKGAITTFSSRSGSVS